SEGELTKHILKWGSLPDQETRRWFRQILRAVQYCHSNSIVHRDIKDNNILVDGRGNAKLSDFSLAVKLQPGEKILDFCGTLPYCAPELFGTEPYDGYPTDVWSLGVLLFVMVSGYLPFGGSSDGELMLQVQAADVTIPSHVSLDVSDVIAELLAVHPGRRPTVDQILVHPMVRDGEARSPPSCRQTLEGPSGPSIVRAMKIMGYEPEKISQSLRYQKYDQVMATYLILQHQAPWGDWHDHRGKKVLAGRCFCHPGRSSRIPCARKKASEPVFPNFDSPPEPQEEEEDEKISKQGARRHSMPAILRCQHKRTHPQHLYDQDSDGSFLSSSPDISDNYSNMASYGSLAIDQVEDEVEEEEVCPALTRVCPERAQLPRSPRGFPCPASQVSRAVPARSVQLPLLLVAFVLVRLTVGVAVACKPPSAEAEAAGRLSTLAGPVGRSARPAGRSTRLLNVPVATAPRSVEGPHSLLLGRRASNPNLRRERRCLRPTTHPLRCRLLIRNLDPTPTQGSSQSARAEPPEGTGQSERLRMRGPWHRPRGPGTPPEGPGTGTATGGPGTGTPPMGL
ncbi:sperm motility kinase X-like, partial [Nannospalax galili]|uniref:sperm motility kinase X-like n=1 Tax=Nannospalax galili TaxID=1026970 RepID=UPI0004ED1831